nr:MAG TPA: hypothetical protein [Caudoviricetes sp.]
MKQYRNKKNGNIYLVLTLDGIDCTNERDGLKVVIYTNGELYFTREYSEFMAKFEAI